MNDKKILKNILSAKVLEKYFSQDQYLEKLIDKLENLLDDWKSINDIYVGNKTINAAKIEAVFRTRLKLLIETETTNIGIDELNRLTELRSATSVFVDYLNSHPDAEIISVIFNCDKYHYRVKCGILNQKIDVICVLKGGRIPENILQGNP